jgi:protein CrcB
MRSSLIIFVGVGGVLRHLLNAWIMRLARLEFPLGILTINVIGSTAMGLVAGGFAFKGHAPHDVRLFLTTGILGGFTTFSAFRSTPPSAMNGDSLGWRSSPSLPPLPCPLAAYLPACGRCEASPRSAGHA